VRCLITVPRYSHGLTLLERAPGVSVDAILSQTDATLSVLGEVPEMAIH
jgi:acyl CoA:acetate/3-ketoacid CoA transferase beta subunit